MANDKKITVDQLRDFAQKADERLDDLEASRPVGRALLLASGGWTQDSGDENYPYRYVLAAEGVTAASRADAVLDAASAAAAAESGVCAATETEDGAVIFKSETAPAADLTGVLYITKTAAMTSTQEG